MWVWMSYYQKPTEVTKLPNNLSPVTTNTIIDNIPTQGNEIITNVDPNLPKEEPTKPMDKVIPIVPGQPVVVKSDDEISDKDKQEVLDEIDNTLRDLFDLVDRVQIVDEDRLIVDGNESEVHP